MARELEPRMVALVRESLLVEEQSFLLAMMVAAGIGTGELSSCKSILITKDVKSVIAQKGNDGYESIGLGSNDDGSTCGEITIEDPSKVTQK